MQDPLTDCNKLRGGVINKGWQMKFKAHVSHKNDKRAVDKEMPVEITKAEVTRDCLTSRLTSR